jgi:hypothetical protein
MKQPSVYLKMRVLGAIDTAPGRTRHERVLSVATMAFLDEEGNPRQFTWRTIQTWFYRYKNHGITGVTTADGELIVSDPLLGGDPVHMPVPLQLPCVACMLVALEHELIHELPKEIKKAAALGDLSETVIAVISRSGTLYMVDDDGYDVATMLTPDRMEICYLHLSSGSRIASCTELSRQPQ